MNTEQTKDEELQDILRHPGKSSLVLKLFPIDDSNKSIYCDTSQPKIRPWIPKALGGRVIQKHQGIAHPRKGLP